MNKWLFSSFREDIQNFNYLKSIPFCTFSDINNVQYDLIGDILDAIYYDKDKFVSIGEKQAPFGFSIPISSLSNKSYNELLNSCQFSFVFSSDIKETNFLIRSVLAGIIPICNENHTYIKQLKLTSFSTKINKEDILDKLNDILYYKHIYHSRVYKLSWNYFNQIKKWRRER